MSGLARRRIRPRSQFAVKQCCADRRALLPKDTPSNNAEDFDREGAPIVRTIKRDGVEWAVLICRNCGGEFERRADDYRLRGPKACRFGSTACANDNLRRRQRRGLMIIDAALHWRGDRSNPVPLNELCRMIGLMLDEDRAAGRPSW